MRFMMLLIASDEAAEGVMPTAEQMEAMAQYHAAMEEAGVLLAVEGLQPSAMGARVTFTGGKPVVTDGPFTEAKEVIAGYWLIQVGSKEEAVEWAARCPDERCKAIEVRRLYELSDLPPELREAAG